ncbi:hypothetical protein EBT31_11935 [bacterium]|nr:hypothetical protein [bacterium]
MAFTGNYTCNTFKIGLMNGTFDFTTDTFKIALYTNTATLNADTTAYTTTGEASGGNYVAGGLALTVTQVPTIGNQTGQNAVVYISFDNASWTGAITARGALIYKDGGGDPAVCVLDFGSTKTSVNTFEVQFPTSGSTTSIIRLV